MKAFDIFWVINPIEFLIFNEAVSLFNLSTVQQLFTSPSSSSCSKIFFSSSAKTIEFDEFEFAALLQSTWNLPLVVTHFTTSLDYQLKSLFKAGVPWWGTRGGMDPPSSKKCFEGGPRGANHSNHSTPVVLINIQYFHIRVCRTKICNRNHLKHQCCQVSKKKKKTSRKWNENKSKTSNYFWIYRNLVSTTVVLIQITLNYKQLTWTAESRWLTNFWIGFSQYFSATFLLLSYFWFQFRLVSSLSLITLNNLTLLH